MANGRRVVLVTGASRGLGAAIAVHLASKGHAVAVNHRNSDAIAIGVVEQITENGGEAAAFAAATARPSSPAPT